MKESALLAFCVALFIPGIAQLSYEGEPLFWSDKRFPDHLSYRIMPELDLETLAAEDEVVDQYKEAPWRFGVEHDVSWTPYNSGVWTLAESEQREVWQLAIWCPEATSISFLFGNYRLKKGEELFIWTEDRTRFLGKFDHRNNAESGVFPVGILHAERVVVELSVPIGKSDGIELELSQVVHGYRSLLRSDMDYFAEERGPFGNSQSCNINVNCPVAANWQVVKRSIALIVSGGNAVCSGALVNNTAQDGTPYFLTANHCLPSNTANVANWVFYFNHEAAGCAGNNGPTNQSIAGSVLRARRAGSDFALLQLNNTPPSSWNVHYAGWDRSDNQASLSSAVGIHHPSGDVKKICFEDNQPVKTTVQNTAVWYIYQWELGVTEGGSSGSPLFDQNQRVIGQLLGGGAACSSNPNLPNNGQPDWYGRFGISWNTGTSATQRLRDWLDPLNLNPVTLNGYPSASAGTVIDAGLGAIGGVQGSVCQSQVSPSVVLINAGSQTLTSAVITYTLNSNPSQNFAWSGSLPPGQTTVVNLPPMLVSGGMNSLVVMVSNPNGQSDSNGSNNMAQVQFNAFTGPVYNAQLTIQLDNYPQETSWQIVQNNQVIYESGGTYEGQPNGSTVVVPLCFGAGCYTLVMQDSHGDGLCCQYGQGSYTLTNQFGEVVASGSQFQFSQSTTFCISAVGVEEESEPYILLYPNPVSEVLNIRTSHPGLYTFEIYDVTGRMVMSGSDQGPRSDLTLGALSDGMYVLRWQSNGQRIARNFVVKR